MLRTSFTAALGFAVTLFIFSGTVAAQNRGPSTLEERKHAVQLATSLENDPLSKNAKDKARELLVFLANVPDITITMCLAILGPAKSLKGDYESDIVGQVLFSQAKFVIENPEKAGDSFAVSLGAVEGVIRTWKSIKAAKPKAKFPLMDELVQKQEAGTLGDYVRAQMTNCK